MKLYAAEALMDSQRMIKDSEEIDRLRKAAKLTDHVVDALIPTIQEGMSQDELQQHIEKLGHQFGASDVSFPPTVGFVQSGSKPSLNISNVAKDIGLKMDTTIFLDIGFVLKGYCSDFGRSFFYGSLNKDVRKGYEALQQSVIDVVSEMHAGSMRVCDIYPKLEKMLNARGYGNELRARLGKSRSVGHSIGIEVHEPPRLNPFYDDFLCKNMVLAVEPKIWSPGEYYLRVEDIVLIGAKKSEFLTEFDRDLFHL